MMRRWLPGTLLLLAAAGVFCGPAQAGTELRIVVGKTQRQLLLFRGDQVIRSYPVSLGRSPTGAKETLGDMKTPVGRYFIHEKREKTKYHRFLAINYPALSDAERAFQAGRISAAVWADIWYASARRQKPPWNTVLGGFVGIHGTGAEGRKARLRQVLDWTEGCVALSDRHIEELFDLVSVGTPVEIFEDLNDVTRPRLTEAAAIESSPVPLLGAP